MTHLKNHQSEIRVQCRRLEKSSRGVSPDGYIASLHKVTIKESEPRNPKQALSGPDKDQWKKAMDITSSQKNGACDIVPEPKSKNIVTCKWVFKVKRNSEREY